MAPLKAERSILVVEDCDEDFETVQEALADADVAVSTVRAKTGGDAVEFMRSSAGSRPVLVMLDLNTPGYDGRQALAELKSDPKTNATPIVVLSTSADPRDLSYSYRNGANAYHVKPVQYPEHLNLIKRLIEYWLKDVIPPASEGPSP